MNQTLFIKLYGTPIVITSAPIHVYENTTLRRVTDENKILRSTETWLQKVAKCVLLSIRFLILQDWEH